MAALAGRSGGNPLFVRELVAAARSGTATESLPESVETLITTRIDALDPSDRMLLRYASVIGPSFDLDLLNRGLQGDVDDVGDLDRWRRLGEFVAWDADDVLRFRHDLSGRPDTPVSPSARRREIHRRVGEALEQRAEEEAAILSLHFLEAGDSSAPGATRSPQAIARVSSTPMSSPPSSTTVRSPRPTTWSYPTQQVRGWRSRSAT